MAICGYKVVSYMSMISFIELIFFGRTTGDFSSGTNNLDGVFSSNFNDID